MASAYSQEKLSQFFDHIDLPKSLRKDIRPSLMLLKALHTHSLATFPYENLSLHYNTTHSIDLGPQHLFRKMVADRRGRGGFTRGRLEGVPRGDYPGQAIHKAEETKLWIYQYRNGEDKEWNSFYSFPSIEFFALDWDVVKWWINTHADSHQRRNVLTIKFLLQPVEVEAKFEGEMEIYGKRMLVNGVVKENLRGKTQIITTCNTEGERVEALGKHFQISLFAAMCRCSEALLFTLHFNQLTSIISNSHTPQLLAMSHQELIATLRTRPECEILMRLVVIDSRDEFLPVVVADDSPRNTVSEAQPSISFDTLPVKASSRVEALTKSEVPVDDGDDFA
uniref:Arylamine N-acetyltransferase 4 n=1 Tax=Gibberella moniliformis TaxID=117187 RepID=D8FSV0_GIBMO|nr:TPA: arylamine N-acetyltransferase 4 [[Gibberella] fujikuroi var. moniliformis]